ncbi:MAG TPA: alpha/beta hydrolase-fold protein, partial [Bacteroidota bacterium]|nr:alpha/beta hydrolase-fold protein [Bacteroidota bacterium]
MQQAKSLEAHVTYDLNLRYLLQLPDGYGQSEEKWPMVLFLHGMGERGSDLELVKRHGPPKLVESGEKFPFILVSPQCPTDEFWSVPVLKSFLDAIEGLYAVDSARRYLTGLSMGGNGAWRMAVAYPNHFAALAPICGWGDPTSLAVLKDLPVWVFHGMK